MLNYTEKHKEHPPEVWSVPPVTPCIKSVLWRVAKCLSYIEEARCLKVKVTRHLSINTLLS